MHAGPNLECSIVKMTERSPVTVKLFFLVQTGTEQIISYKLSAYLIVWISAIAKSVLYTMYNSLQSKQYMENTSVWDHCFLVHLLCWGKWYNMVEIKPYWVTSVILFLNFFYMIKLRIDKWKFSKLHSMWFLKYKKVYI